ncbi:NlpC/P60 family protein, partial [Kitasatospora sp. NPDC093558]|uniref:C40 family peptidase n=1 Tax=Kitasatospora sp. NPDC093558 TaxID=3155201 RepID=UPI003438209A
AVMAQGRLMCSLLAEAEHSGIPGDSRALALAGYNAGWGAVTAAHGIPPFPETKKYVDDILSNLARFQPSSHPFEVAGVGDGPDAVRRAMTQIGLPYSYGGGTPTGPTTGFCTDNNGYTEGHCTATTTIGWDCSALTQYAYWPTHQLPRNAADQYTATAHHPITRTELRPGDLLFWTHGGESGIYHVAIYAGDGQMVTAPKTGDMVKVAPTDTMPEGDYVGATRP